jgi:hypothetical protein
MNTFEEFKKIVGDDIIIKYDIHESSNMIHIRGDEFYMGIPTKDLNDCTSTENSVTINCFGSFNVTLFRKIKYIHFTKF